MSEIYCLVLIHVKICEALSEKSDFLTMKKCFLFVMEIYYFYSKMLYIKKKQGIINSYYTKLIPKKKDR